MKFLKFITDFLAWLQIIVSPLIIGGIAAFFVSQKYPTKTGFYIGIFIALLGLIIGIVWATKIWKKGGTMEFISKISSKPELDKLKE